MAWTTPRTWVAGEVPTAAIMNAHVRDNLQYLLQRPYNAQADAAGLSDLTSSSTSYVNVSADYSKTVAIKSGRALVYFSGRLSLTNSGGGNIGGLRLVVDATNYSVGVITGDQVITFAWVIGALSDGNHTFTMQWYVNAGNTINLKRTLAPTSFLILEV